MDPGPVRLQTQSQHTTTKLSCSNKLFFAKFLILDEISKIISFFIESNYSFMGSECRNLSAENVKRQRRKSLFGLFYQLTNLLALSNLNTFGAMVKSVFGTLVSALGPCLVSSRSAQRFLQSFFARGTLNL